MACVRYILFSAVFSRGAGGAYPPEYGGSQKRRSLIIAYQSLAITSVHPWIWKAKYSYGLG